MHPVATVRLRKPARELKLRSKSAAIRCTRNRRLPAALPEAGLDDPLCRQGDPVILGAGERLFTTPLTIEPMSTTAFSRGAVAHVFTAHP